MQSIKIRNKVKIQRIQMGKYNQIELAKEIGVSRQTMNLIEAEKYNPSIKICLLISVFLNTSVDELFWIEKE